MLPFKPPRGNKAVLPPVREVARPQVVLQHPDRVEAAAVVLEAAVDEAANRQQLLQVPHRGFPMESLT